LLQSSFLRCIRTAGRAYSVLENPVAGLRRREVNGSAEDSARKGEKEGRKGGKLEELGFLVVRRMEGCGRASQKYAEMFQSDVTVLPDCRLCGRREASSTSLVAYWLQKNQRKTLKNPKYLQQQQQR